MNRLALTPPALAFWRAPWRMLAGLALSLAAGWPVIAQAPGMVGSPTGPAASSSVTTAMAHAPWPDDAVLELRRAERITHEGATSVRLPDTLRLPPGAQGPVHTLYRFTVQWAEPPRRLAICMPGLIAHARIRVNGHVVDDRLGDPLAPLPRSIDSIRLVEVPPEFVHAGANLIEVEAAGRTMVSLSALNVGPREAMHQRYERRVMQVVIGPAIVAVVVASLAVCVLLLWARRGDPLYGYFGLGALGLALHNAWSVLPAPLLPGIHNLVWWTSLYTFFVAMLVIFCVRFAGWRWRRFDLTLCALAASAPALLYAAHAFDLLMQAQEAWLLAWISVVAVGLAAVGRYAWTHRNADGALLILTGAVSLAFAVRDWLVNHRGDDNNPVFLVPYAGLLFVMLVAWMLIDRFVDASRRLEAMNIELEQRVSAKSAQLVHALEEMRAAKDSAEAANRAKTTFLAAASHDLRQPVHALGLYMAALADDHLDADQQDLVLRMKASLTALDTMFNALLDISRMDAGAVVPRPRPFVIEPMLHRLAEESASLAAQKGLRLSVRVAPAPPSLHARGDPVLVERIVRNLLGNAVRYTAAGGVLLSCRLRRAPRPHWRVEVWDTGPGIAEGDRERVFDEFYQVGNPERDRASGLGLGLSIVRRLTALLDLPLTLHSRLGRGTRFTLELPCTEEPLPRHARDKVAGGLHGLVVAVIDDDPEVRDGMQLLLTRWGCRVLAGADADEVLHGLQAVPGLRLRAIVADFRLRGGHTGIDAVRRLHAALGWHAPALIVSGDSSPEPLLQMQSSGFDCMSKPVKPARLRQWLAMVAEQDVLQPDSAGAPALIDEEAR